MSDDSDATEELPIVKRARVAMTSEAAPPLDDAVASSAAAAAVRPRPSPATCHFVNLPKRRTTWAHGIAISTLFERPAAEPSGAQIEQAIVGTYLFDPGFVSEFAPELLRARRVTLVHGCAGLSAGDVVAALPNFRVVRPDVPVPFGESMHHAKYFIMQWAQTLRVVVSTANATDDYSRRSNQVWMQDFVRCDARTRTSKGLDFLEQLARYLAAVGLRDWVSVVSAHNFDAVQAHLVCSMPGVFTGHEMARYGHLRMRALLSRLQPMPAAFRRPSLMAQFSSLGRTSDAWLFDQWMTSMMPPTAVAGVAQSAARQTKQTRAALSERLFLVWPTVAFVRDCFFGYAVGLSLCGQRASFELDCIRSRLFKFRPQHESRRDITPHMKSYAVFDASAQGAAVPLAYYLMTSANLSKQAWGELQKDESQFVLKNFELGVVLLQSEVDALSSAPKRALLAADRGADRAASLDAPLIVDLRALQRMQFLDGSDGDDDESPWSFDMQHRGLDRFGQRNQVVVQNAERFARRK
jgi:tyrosyl-DNA phosphodiesterase-1